MNYAIIGLGTISKYYIKYLGEENLLGYFDIEKKDCKYKQYENIEELISDKQKLDVVLILTPPSHHFEYIELLCKTDIPFLVEKPLVNDLSQYQLCKKIMKGKKYFLPLHSVIAPEVDYYLDNSNLFKKLGSMQRFESFFSDPYIVNDDIQKKQLEGSYVDSFVNAYSIINRIVNGNLINRSEHSEKLESGITTKSLDVFTGSTYGCIITCWDSNNIKKTTLYFEKGRIEFDHNSKSITIYNGDTVEDRISFFSQIKKLDYQYEAISKNILNNKYDDIINQDNIYQTFLNINR